MPAQCNKARMAKLIGREVKLEPFTSKLMPWFEHDPEQMSCGHFAFVSVCKVENQEKLIPTEEIKKFLSNREEKPIDSSDSENLIKTHKIDDVDYQPESVDLKRLGVCILSDEDVVRLQQKWNKRPRQPQMPKVINDADCPHGQTDLSFMGGTKIPSWLCLLMRQFLVSVEPCELFIKKFLVTSPVVEITSKPSVYEMVLPIIKVLLAVCEKSFSELQDSDKKSRLNHLKSLTDDESKRAAEFLKNEIKLKKEREMKREKKLKKKLGSVKENEQQSMLIDVDMKRVYSAVAQTTKKLLPKKSKKQNNLKKKDLSHKGDVLCSETSHVSSGTNDVTNDGTNDVTNDVTNDDEDPPSLATQSGDCIGINDDSINEEVTFHNDISLIPSHDQVNNTEIMDNSGFDSFNDSISASKEQHSSLDLSTYTPNRMIYERSFVHFSAGGGLDESYNSFAFNNTVSYGDFSSDADVIIEEEECESVSSSPSNHDDNEDGEDLNLESNFLETLKDRNVSPEVSVNSYESKNELEIVDNYCVDSDTVLENGSEEVIIENENGDNLGKENENTDNLGKDNENTNNLGKENENTDNLVKENENTDNLGKENENTDNLGKENENTDNFGKDNETMKNLCQRLGNLDLESKPTLKKEKIEPSNISSGTASHENTPEINSGNVSTPIQRSKTTVNSGSSRRKIASIVSAPSSLFHKDHFDEKDSSQTFRIGDLYFELLFNELRRPFLKVSGEPSDDVVELLTEEFNAACCEYAILIVKVSQPLDYHTKRKTKRELQHNLLNYILKKMQMHLLNLNMKKIKSEIDSLTDTADSNGEATCYDDVSYSIYLRKSALQAFSVLKIDHQISLRKVKSLQKHLELPRPERKSLFYSYLNFPSEIIDKLPSSVQFVVFSICYWYQNSLISVDRYHIYALLTSYVMFGFVDSLLGRIRDQEELQLLLYTLSSPGQNQKDLYKKSNPFASVSNSLKNTNKKDCAAAALSFLPYHSPQNKTVKLCLQNEFIHAMSEFQICYYFLSGLNGFLGAPFGAPPMDQVMNPTFACNIYIALKNSADEGVTMSEILKDSNQVKALLDGLHKVVAEILSLPAVFDLYHLKNLVRDEHGNLKLKIVPKRNISLALSKEKARLRKKAEMRDLDELVKELESVSGGDRKKERRIVEKNSNIELCAKNKRSKKIK